MLTWTTGFLKDHGSESPRLEAEVLLAHALGCERIMLYARFGEEPNEAARSLRRLALCFEKGGAFKREMRSDEAGDIRMARVFDDFARRASFEYAAIAHDDEAVGECAGEREVMRDEEQA